MAQILRVRDFPQIRHISHLCSKLLRASCDSKPVCTLGHRLKEQRWLGVGCSWGRRKVRLREVQQWFRELPPRTEIKSCFCSICHVTLSCSVAPLYHTRLEDSMPSRKRSSKLQEWWHTSAFFPRHHYIPLWKSLIPVTRESFLCIF